MTLFILNPWYAGLVGGAFLILFVIVRQRIVVLTAVAWFAYMVYEYAIMYQILCDAECNIRIDLLAFYPALGVLSLVSVAAFGRHVRNDRPKTDGPGDENCD